MPTPRIRERVKPHFIDSPRSAELCRTGNGMGNDDGRWLSDEIADWKAAGLTDIVSLLEDHEIRELDLAREAELAERAGLSFERFPIPDRGVPV
jgi:hypothetical protein